LTNLIFTFIFSESTSEEFDEKTKSPAIVFMPEGSKTHMGGTMSKSRTCQSLAAIPFITNSPIQDSAREPRSSTHQTPLLRSSIAVPPPLMSVTDTDTKVSSTLMRLALTIDHRTNSRSLPPKVNPTWVEDLEKEGKLRFVGKDETGQRMEIAELPSDIHPFFLGTQYHPEFLSRPRKPSPPFLGFVAASAGRFKSFYNLQQQ